MMQEKLRTFYSKLKAMRWPIIAFRIALVVSIIGLLLVVALSLLGVAISIGVFFAAGAYVLVLSLSSIILLLGGAASTKKSYYTLNLRKRSIQISGIIVLASVFLKIQFIDQYIPLEFVLGVFGFLSIFYFINYFSQLVLEGMYFSDFIDGEGREELYFRRALYIPAQMVRDLIIPVIAFSVALFLVYDFSFCLTALSAEFVLAEFISFFESSMSSFSWFPYLTEKLSLLLALLTDFIYLDEVQIRSNWGVFGQIFHPSCRGIRPFYDGHLHLL